MSLEGQGSIFLWNIDITAHLYKVQNPRNKINIAFTMYEMNIAYYEPYKTQTALTKLLTAMELWIISDVKCSSIVCVCVCVCKYK